MTTEPTSTVASIWHKVIAGIFAGVIAPVLVAFGVKFSDKVLTPPTPPAATPPAATAPVATTPAAATAPTAPAVAATAPAATTPAVAAATHAAVAPASPAAPAVAATPPAGNSSVSGLAIASASAPTSDAHPTGEVIMPSFKKPSSAVQRLFNGRDLTGFYTYLGRQRPKTKPIGKNYDPDKVFSVEEGMIHITGETHGVLETEKEYSDYWLTVEYKWGEKTWPPDADGARHSALLLNIQGPDGVIHGAFPTSFHVQMVEGVTGDLLIASGEGETHYSLTAAVEEKHTTNHTIVFYTPGAPRATFAQGVIKRYPPGPLAHDVKGFHPAGDLERPTGEWNKLECAVLNGKIWVRLNDHVVNFAMDTTPSGGRIGIQSHGAELFIREMTLQPYLKHHEHTEASN